MHKFNQSLIYQMLKQHCWQ